jgi:hypothetical protein
MKSITTILFAGGLLAMFSLASLAQDSRAASSPTWGIPSVPGTIVFYGGDINVNDPNAQGFNNGNTLLAPQSAVYAPVTAPKSGKIVVSSVFVNQSPSITSGKVFDPPTATYDVRTGLSEGNCGTSLASGSGSQTAVLTGRSPFGFPEYTTTVSFAHSLTAKNGTTYWFNESPQCTNSANGNCSSEQFYFSNTTQQTNGVNANAQPKGQMYSAGASLGTDCHNVCDGSQNSQQCAWGSWGLTK